MVTPTVLHFSHLAEVLGEPVLDQPAAARCVGDLPPPQRKTWSLYEAPLQVGQEGQSNPAELDCGIWECEPGAWTIAFHPGRHEYFHVLSGELIIHGKDGSQNHFSPGQAGIIPAGFEGVFEVLTPVRKHYVMVDVG
jgi:uncharacterized cupin superfamily protein